MATATKRRKAPPAATVYSWRPGVRVPVPAAAAGAELDRLRRAGPVTPAAVVDAARDPDSPLHPAFCWDDTAAAEAYRRDQARTLLHSIRVTVAGGAGGPPQVVYLSVSTREEGRAYLPAAEVMSDVEYRRQAVAEAWAALEGWRRRHAHLTELAGVFEAIDAAPRPARGAARKTG